jgi:hypothetical protein
MARRAYQVSLGRFSSRQMSVWLIARVHQMTLMLNDCRLCSPIATKFPHHGQQLNGSRDMDIPAPKIPKRDCNSEDSKDAGDASLASFDHKSDAM